MMKLFVALVVVIACVFQSVYGFQANLLIKTRSYASQYINTSSNNRNINKLSMSADSVNEFAASTVSATTATASNSNDELPPVDFEELSKESASEAFQPKTDLSEFYVKTERKAPRQSGWLPLTLAPESLDGSYAGDVGFDPLGFCRSIDDVKKYREVSSECLKRILSRHFGRARETRIINLALYLSTLS